ncbi:ankyrin repeat-containing protein [Naganishia albida]|nr:ankyrin repeat-containing protein [Naganishia albida]
MTRARPTEEEVEDLLLSCRYGDLEDVKAFVEQYGAESVQEARDDRGNNVLHMCCGNGHADVLEFLLSILPSSLLQTTNDAKSPPLHWAILNSHLNCVKILVELPEERGGGMPLLNQTNASGRDAFHESVWLGEGREEVAGWIEGFIVKIEGPDMEGTAEDEKKHEVNGNKVEEFEQRDESAEEVKGDKQDVDDVVDRADKLEL